MNIKKIGLGGFLSWGRRFATKQIGSDKETSKNSFKALRDVHLETAKIKQETGYIKKTGKTPPPRTIIGPNGDVKKIKKV